MEFKGSLFVEFERVEYWMEPLLIGNNEIPSKFIITLS
jgi:hypothetical protein